MPIPDDLTTLESKLVDAASGGGIAGPEPPYHVLAGASWPRELTVRAELLRALLVSGPPTTVSADRPLQLRGARILGAVDLEAATIQRPVRFDGCYFLDAINLSEATTRSVSLVNCQLAGMSADQVEIRGNLGLASTICVGELRLRAARITGDLLLDGAKLYGSGGIALDGLGLFVQQAVTGKTRFEAYGTVSLYRADIGDLNLNGAKLTAPAGHALYAEVLRVRGSIMCGAGFESKGAVWLAGAAVGGQLLLNGAKLSNPGGNALVGDGLKVEGDLRLRLGFETNGELRLVGADVRGAVEVSGSHLRNPGGVALNGDHLRVGRSMFYNGTTIEGAVWLEEAHIGGSIEMDGASLHNPGDVALKGTGLVVDQNVVCSRGFTANGQLQFDGARIGGNLEFEKASMDGSAGVALDLSGLGARQLVFLPGVTPRGIVNATRARLDHVRDQPTCWPRGSRIEGLTYGSLEPSGASERLPWLERLESSYRPQVYESLIDACTRAGRVEDARRIVIAKQRHRRKDGSAMSRVGGYFLDGAIGYGQRNGRALWWLLLILVIDTIAFHFAHAHGQIRAVHAAGRHQFQAVAYALDSLLPIVNLHQRDTFVATGYARWIVWVSVLLGWALATAVAAALAGLLRTRDS